MHISRIPWHDRSERRTRASLLILSVLVLQGCGQQKGPGGGFQMPPTPVEVAPVERDTVSDRFETLGSIEAGDQITVVPEISGVVQRLPFDEGEPVRKGDLIAQLEDTELQASVARAEAIRQQEKLSRDRIKAVVDEGAGAPQDLDDAQAKFQVADADLALAKARLAKTRMYAPFAGVVGARRLSPGAFVNPGDPITDLAQFDEVKVSFSAPERYIDVLVVGRDVTVTALAYPDAPTRGKISVVEPVLDRGTRSLRVWARFPNPDHRLRPGMSANVSATLAERDAALVVPAEAVFAEGDQFLVFVVKADSTVARTPVTLGTRLSNVVEIASGLEANTTVVRAGHQKLYEGAKVMPIPGAASAAPPGAPPGGGQAAATGDGSPDTTKRADHP